MDSHEIENQIRDLLATESNCWTLSDKLFGPGGLFSLLGPTIEDRKRVGRSPLFKDAQKRIRELQRQRAQLLRGELKRHSVGV
ncbi:MAG: hypothetical protein EXS16_20295 [Gemmataceae bacterium]|nr:hypothetical protein [Gemmataceae bacterium]